MIPGNGGGFYCENCIRDSTLLRALRLMGHDVVAIPMYLPLPAAEFGGYSIDHVFYGAVSLYLSQTLRRLPRPLARLLDSPPALALAARLSASTRASGLADLTLAMLEGSGDFLRRELDALARWLSTEVRPDVIHLSDGLLLGMAGRLKAETGAPVVVSLQDEHTWIEDLPPDAAERAWGLLRRDAADADLFLPVSRWYGGWLSRKLGVGEERMRVVNVGIDVGAYRPTPPENPPRIGFLSRLSVRNGFPIAARAFAELSRMPGMERVRFSACGGSTGDDAGMVRSVLKDLRRRGLGDRVDIRRGFSAPQRTTFLSGLSLLSVPAPAGEAFGTFLVEALASGVPVVEPRAGAFPEIVEGAGGVITEVASPAELAAAMADLLTDRARAQALGEMGRRTVLSRYTMERMARGMAEAFSEAAGKRRTA